MRKLLYLLMVPALIMSCGSGVEEKTEEALETVAEEVTEATEEVAAKEKPKSPRMDATGLIGGVKVDVNYGSPYVKERKIWGELVPYDKMWRAGANETTAVTFASDVTVNGSDIKAGTYGMFVIPAEEGNWTVVMNEQWSEPTHDVWGTYGYDESKDILRFEVTPAFGTENVESLTFDVTDSGVTFAWEMASFSFPVAVK